MLLCFIVDCGPHMGGMQDVNGCTPTPGPSTTDAAHVPRSAIMSHLDVAKYAIETFIVKLAKAYPVREIKYMLLGGGGMDAAC